MFEQARALEQAGKRTQALALYERLLAARPNDAAVLTRLAFNHLNRGDNARARDFAARAAALDARSSEAWIVLGAARDALGERTAAREAYKSCVELGHGDYVTECRRMVR
jgi:Flp pilus assembly protein TadD